VKSTTYSRASLKLFHRFYSQKRKNLLLENNVLLEEANIVMDYDEYFSMVLMNTLIGFICPLILLLAIQFGISIGFPLFLYLLPPLIALSIGACYAYLPNYIIKRRAFEIDMFLPYAVNFISSMAVAGITPAEVFTKLSMINVYGEIQTEAKKIAKEINVMGVDSLTALKHAMDISPSKKFKSFLQGIIGTIQSGSDLHIYLSKIVDKFMEDDLVDRKRDLDLLSVIAEIFVVSVIAFPIFLVIILTVFGFFGGSMNLSITILILFSVLILPLIYLCFFYLIKSTSIEEIGKLRSSSRFTFKRFYVQNKIPLMLVALSSFLMVILYGATYLLSIYGYLELDLYLHLDFLFLSILLLVGPIGMYKYLEMKKMKEVQDRLPDFLTEIGDSLSTGMTIFDAIRLSAKARYGRLSKEINTMKTQLSWNVSISEVLNFFSERMKSAIIHRIVIALNKGLLMGGKTSEIFMATSREIGQVNKLENQRKANMSIYTIVIILCFFVFLTIIIILDKTIFSSFYELRERQLVQLGNYLMVSVFDPTLLKYALYSFVYVQSIGAGLLSGFMTDGKLSSGIRYSCILGLVSFFIFKYFF
jgi:pilus assembly protein TadC